MSEPVLLLEKRDAVAIITLNRPHAMNAISLELRTAISTTFRQLQQDDDIAAAIIIGNGRAFCAGLDLKELSAGGSIESIEYEDTVPLPEPGVSSAAGVSGSSAYRTQHRQTRGRPQRRRGR